MGIIIAISMVLLLPVIQAALCATQINKKFAGLKGKSAVHWNKGPLIHRDYLPLKSRFAWHSPHLTWRRWECRITQTNARISASSRGVFDYLKCTSHTSETLSGSHRPYQCCEEWDLFFLPFPLTGRAVCDVQKIWQATVWKRPFWGLLHWPSEGAGQHTRLHLRGTAGRRRKIRLPGWEHRPVEWDGQGANGPRESESLIYMYICM